MPRVFRKTKNRGGHKVYACSAPTCRIERDGGTRDIRPGDDYLTWKFNRGSRFFRHAECGYPKRSELSNSKMAAVWDAVDDFDVSAAASAEDIKSDLEAVAQAAREVADEYQAAADSILSAFPSGNTTSEACSTTADELNSWADDLESWEPDDEFDADNYTGVDAEEAEQAWLEECRQSAQDKVNESPEYQG